MPTKEKDSIQLLDRKLTIIINLLAYQIVQGKTIAEGAPLLKRMGLSQSEIAGVFDSTANAISVRLAEAKKKANTTKSK
jgi:hypothetical protein